MAYFNKVMLLGNITRDPELRYTPKGMAVLDLGMAMTRKYRLDSGETREETTFVDVTFWSQQAETIQKWCKKGRPIMIEGRLQLDTWDDKVTGKKTSRLRVVGENFQMLYGREGAAGLAANPAGAPGAPAGGYDHGAYPPQQPQQGGYAPPPAQPSYPPQGGGYQQGGYPQQGGGGGYSQGGEQAGGFRPAAPPRPAGPPPQMPTPAYGEPPDAGTESEQIPF